MRLLLPEWYTGNVPWLFACRAAHSFSLALLVIVVPLYVSTAGYSTLWVGYLLSIVLASSTGITILVGVFSDRYGRKSLSMIIAGLAVGNNS
jgi:MFS family permease